jgi:hypothetical protein
MNRQNDADERTVEAGGGLTLGFEFVRDRFVLGDPTLVVVLLAVWGERCGRWIGGEWEVWGGGGGRTGLVIIGRGSGLRRGSGRLRPTASGKCAGEGTNHPMDEGPVLLETAKRHADSFGETPSPTV